MSTPDPVAEILAAVADCLHTLGVRWYLFGAQAVVIWGRPRLTADVDITVEVDPTASRHLVEAIEGAGFDLRIAHGVEDFVARTRVLPFVHHASGVQLDVVLAGPGLEERFMERAQLVAFGARAIPVISPENLIVTKILAGRPKDLDDVRGILAERHGRLELEEVRSLLELLEAALGQSDLLPLFEGELTRARRDTEPRRR